MKKIFSFVMFLVLIQTTAFNKNNDSRAEASASANASNKEYIYTCGSSDCTCDIEYTITNDTGEEWTGQFLGAGAPYDCDESLAVPNGSSTTFTATIDANELGSDDIKYFVTPTGNSPNFNDPNLSIIFSSACDLNEGVNNQGNARIIPVNGGCGEVTCDFTVLIDGCHVCFTAHSNVPGIQHSWDFDGDGDYDVTTPDITVCHTYDEPGGSFDVSHLHTDLTCMQTVTVNCQPDPPCTIDDGEVCGNYELFFDFCYYNEFTCEGPIINVCVNTSTFWDDSPNPNGLPDEVLGVTFWEISTDGINWSPHFNSQGLTNGICTDFDITQVPANSQFRATVQIWGGPTCTIEFELQELCPTDCEDSGFDITTDPNCPPLQYCSICTGGGEVCVTLADGSPINGTAIFYLENNTSIPSGDGCITVGAQTARLLLYVEVFIDNCVFTVHIDFNDPACEGNFAPEDHPQGSQANDAMSIYPNPASQLLKVDNPTENILKGRILTIDGRLMTAFQLNNYETQKLEVNAFPNGIYFLEVTHSATGELVQTQKVIIAH